MRLKTNQSGFSVHNGDFITLGGDNLSLDISRLLVRDPAILFGIERLLFFKQCFPVNHQPLSRKDTTLRFALLKRWWCYMRIWLNSWWRTLCGIWNRYQSSSYNMDLHKIYKRWGSRRCVRFCYFLWSVCHLISIGRHLIGSTYIQDSYFRSNINGHEFPKTRNLL